jgi:hypothetical protein
MQEIEMKSVTEFEPVYNPLFEGSRITVMVKGKQFYLFLNGYRVGFITQYNSRHFNMNLNGKSMGFYSSVDLKRYMIKNMSDYFYTDMNP